MAERGDGGSSDYEERFRALFEHSLDAIYIIDRAGLFLDANQAAQELLGYGREDIGRVNLTALVHPVDLPQIRADIAVILRDGTQRLGRQYHIRARDGRELVVATRSARVRRAGLPDVIIGVARDITEQHHAEQALRASEAKLRSIFRAAPTGIGLVARRVILDVNDTLCSMTGYTRDELMGQSSRLVYATDADFEYVGREKDRQIAVSGTGTVETRWRRKDGTIIDVLLGSTPLEPSDLDQGVTFTALDITARKQAEAQLQQAMKMEAVGRLAGGVAHDFNNLLTAVIGNVSLALADLAPGHPLQPSLANVLESAQSAAELTRQLLSFSRKQLVIPRRVDLNELVRRLEKMLARLIGEDIALRVDAGATDATVTVDTAQFEQILVNLAINARDAMPRGGGLAIETGNVELDEETCRRHHGLMPGPFVMLAVSDTGQGIPPEVMTHLFEPFFTTKPKGQGTGLGLATIYGAVKQAGGSIAVSSEVGRGTTFRIYLPRAEGAPEEMAPRSGATDLPRGRETVLVVEDEPRVRALAANLLGRLGYRVLQAANGGEALDLATRQSESIDLLFTDVVMPGMDGRELAERVRRLYPGVGVLFSSGYAESVIVHDGAVDADVVFLPKPYTPRDLAEKLRVALIARRT